LCFEYALGGAEGKTDALFELGQSLAPDPPEETIASNCGVGGDASIALLHWLFEMGCEFMGSMQHYLNLTEVVFMTQGRRWVDREGISRGIASGEPIREIASGLSRAASTASREVTRHGGRAVYRASEADSEAWKSALRPKLCLLAVHEQLRELVESKLILDWSPDG
jgi:hypothetical protein